LALPALEGAPLNAERPGAAQWINLWATWCKPCVEELPMLVRFEERLSRSGIALSLRFVSVDDSAETVAAFRAAHPNIPESPRLVDATALAPLVQSLGLDAGAGLPIHAFAGPDGKLRCVRAGAVLESHYNTVARLLR
jgi:thiol-disulfide isomerase/thioredoxin